MPQPVLGFDPVNYMCQLESSFGDTSGERATGYLIGPNAVLTAAHAVYVPDRGKTTWVRVRVSPSPMPSHVYDVPGENCHLLDAYRTAPSQVGSPSPFDYAVIELPFPSPRYLGWDILEDHYFGSAGIPFYLAGFPFDEETRSWGPWQYWDQEVTGCDDDFIYYSFRTAAGMSGASLFGVYPDSTGVVVGIHAYGDGESGRAIRVTDAVDSNLRLWSGRTLGS